MLDSDEQVIFENLSLKNYYQHSLFSNVTQHTYIDFFISVLDTTNINRVDLVIEYCSKKEPTEGDWARVQIENYDTNEQVFILSDYIVRKTFASPLTFSIRSRTQGKIMRIGVKANQNGGIITATSFRKNRSKN